MCRAGGDSMHIFHGRLKNPRHIRQEKPEYDVVVAPSVRGFLQLLSGILFCLRGSVLGDRVWTGRVWNVGGNIVDLEGWGDWVRRSRVGRVECG